MPRKLKVATPNPAMRRDMLASVLRLYGLNSAQCDALDEALHAGKLRERLLCLITEPAAQRLLEAQGTKR